MHQIEYDKDDSEWYCMTCGETLENKEDAARHQQHPDELAVQRIKVLTLRKHLTGGNAALEAWLVGLETRENTMKRKPDVTAEQLNALHQQYQDGLQEIYRSYRYFR